MNTSDIVDVYVNSDGLVVQVCRPRRARGSKTFGVKKPRVVQQATRVRPGARYLYR